MSGFGSSGFGGFGQNNNNTGQQSSGFGGFGSNSSGSAFGANNNSNTTTAAFGSNSNAGGGGLFGGASGGSGFGSTSFGSGNNSGAFGAGSKPTPDAFGANTASGGGLFGSNTNTANSGPGFGGFGSTSNANNSNTSGFGTSGGLFGGSNKTFGQGNTPSTGSSTMFGSGANSSGGFGGFGAANNPGIGGNIGEPPGTNSTPFQAHQEKETAGAGNQSNSFQNILFQDPYKKWSAEELRLTDYNQGRRYGNASGTGAFGVSNFGGTGGAFGTNTQTSGGFGNAPSAGGSLFGGNNNNTGSNTNTTGTTGFGSGTGTGFGGGTGLFGNQPKPATSGGGLFGNNSSTTSQTPQAGGLFGNTASGAPGFGASTSGFGTNASSNAGGGLFGSGNTQNKPGGFNFGNSNNTGSAFGSGTTPSGFGTNATTQATGGGLFGSNTSTGGSALFGNNNNSQQQQQQATGTAGFGTSSFGGQNQQSGSLFGGSQAKPTGGLFGSNTANTGGGLFGSSGTGTTSNSAFGTNNNTSGGLFGGQKPATGGGGLFGGSTTTQTASGGGTGLFSGLGSNNQNQQSNSSPFQANNQNQAKPGLFGASQPAAGVGLFGSQNSQQQNSLFGNSATQQPQQPQQSGSVLGGSILGSSQNMGTPTQQSLTASISDLSAYGTPSLFSNLSGNNVPNPGPLATPLSSNKTKSRRSSILPMYKLNPASTSRFTTPQKRGFGFSYSTYGSPGTPSSASSTPGSMNRSLLGSSLNRGLSKSVSSSSLRKSFSAEDSILAPGAFSASSGPRYYGNTGSMRKLVINKDMRSDLFATPTKEKPALDQSNGSRKLSKRVSFDTSNMEVEGSDQDAATPRHSTIVTSDAPSSDMTPVSATKPDTNGSPSDPAQTTGKELAVVHEEDTAQRPHVTHDATDKAPGEYWMSPTPDAISSMNRMQRQKVTNFTVGRDNVGYVCFQVPVDLANIDLADIFGGIVVLETRSATVYPNAAKKPPVGKGLNVPAIISLEQSWPRGRDKRPTADAKRITKHVERLKRIEDTAFIDYDADTGVWKFSVEHFTTYGLDYEEEDTDVDPAAAAANPSTAFPNHPTGPPLIDDTATLAHDDNLVYGWKRRALPGAFDLHETHLADHQEVSGTPDNRGGSFLGYGSADFRSNALILSTEGNMTVEQDRDHRMSEDEDEGGSLLGQGRAHVAPDQFSDIQDDGPDSPALETPGGILRARMRAVKGSATPLRLQIADGDEWMDMLQKSVSPQKRDRALLRETTDANNSTASFRGSATAAPNRVVSDGRGFATSIDLMNSLFEKAKPSTTSQRAPPPSLGFVKWPYERQRKLVDDQSNLSDSDRAFHRSVRPRWGADGTLVLSSASRTMARPAKLGKTDVLSLRSYDQVNGLALLKFSNESAAKAIAKQMRLTRVVLENGVPTASLEVDRLTSIFHDQNLSNAANAHERLVWNLASILFDSLPTSTDLDARQQRKDLLSHFWEGLVDPATTRSVALAKSAEEKALASLAGHRIQDACKHLIQGKNFRLATLVATIGVTEQSKRDMQSQLAEWQNNNVLSDFIDPIRALYELLSGNACVCGGKKDVPIADRMESFVISRRFGLNWKQAFGLRLWYATSRQEDISTAITQFAEDIAQDRECWPQTWYAEQGIDVLWDDPDAGSRQDLLWGLLQLYVKDTTNLETILRPENSQLSPFDSRLCWQLSQALTATGKALFSSISSETNDAITTSFADQLVNEGSWLQATFVLLHLSNPSVRIKAVREHLDRFAGHIDSDTDGIFITLTQSFRIPAAWIWEARAQFMRSVRGDAVGQVQCLLRAKSYNEAHKTLVSEVAPAAIISRDSSRLSKLLSEFEGHEDSVSSWMLGGEIFKLYLTIRDRHQRREKITAEVLEALLQALPTIREASSQSDLGLLAAISEMSSFVARMVVEVSEQDSRDSARVLGLPLTEDAFLRHSLHLSRTYYQATMAGAT